MKLELPSLQVAPGRIICLHIPHGSLGAGEIIERELQQSLLSQGKAAFIAQPAGFDEGDGKLFAAESSGCWLSRIAGVSMAEARRIISGLGVRVDEKVAHNAGTPRALLGIAATLIRKPEIVIYSAIALDAEGCQTLHRFVTSKCRQICVIHVSHPSVYGDGTPHPRRCPPGAECSELVER